VSELIKVEFQRTTDELMSAWEIGKVVDSFGSYYYKFILLDELKKILNDGVQANEIFVLDKSFKLNSSYKALHNDVSNKNIKSLYSTAGLPYSLRPNQKVEILKELFLSFRLSNEELYTIKTGRVKQDELVSIVNRLNSGEFENHVDLFSSIINLCNAKIGENRKNADSKACNRVKNSISSIVNRSIDRIENFISNEIEFKKIYRHYDGEKELINEDIERDYFKKFFKLLEKVNRPLICYYDNNNHIKVLGIKHINISRRDDSFLDVIRIGHNSKLKTKIAGNVVGAIGSVIELLLDEKRKNELHIRELELKSVEIETAEIKKMREKIGLIDDLIEMYEKRNIPIDMSIVSKIIGQDIIEIQKSLQEGTKNLIYTNKMKLINMNEQSTFDEIR